MRHLILPTRRLLRPPGLWIPSMNFAPSRRCCCGGLCPYCIKTPLQLSATIAGLGDSGDDCTCSSLNDTYTLNWDYTGSATPLGVKSCVWYYQFNPLGECGAEWVVVRPHVFNELWGWLIFEDDVQCVVWNKTGISEPQDCDNYNEVLSFLRPVAQPPCTVAGSTMTVVAL